jgi:hypothetical protein
MMNIKIEYNGKDYVVEEPTLELWSKLVSIKDLEDDDDFSIRIISIVTGLTEEEIRKAPWDTIYNASETLVNYLLNLDNIFHDTFELQGVTYKFIDLENMSFGEFIDIDTFLSKDENYRKLNIHEYMALLYRPVVNGVIEEYDVEKMKTRAELFKSLPVKYLNGAVFFFRTLEKVLLHATTSYSYRLRLKLMKKLRPLVSSGGGIQRLVVLLKTTLLKLKKWLSYLWSYVSTTYLTLWTIIKNNKKNLKK